jgi:hypothetical protein
MFFSEGIFIRFCCFYSILFPWQSFLTVNAVDIRLAVIDWSSVESTNTIWDGEYTQGVSSNFFLAMEHFNARRTDVIPALSEVQNCNKNISIVQFCETGGNPLRAVSDLLYIFNEKGPIHGIAGFGGVEDAFAGSLLAEATNNLVSISHWTTAPRLSDKHTFPTYGRTCVSDDDHARVTANFMSQLKFKQVLLVYLADGKDFAGKLSEYLKDFDIQLRSFEFQYTDTVYRDSIDEAVSSASKTELKAVVVATWALQMTLLAEAFDNNKMLSKEYSFFFTYLDRDPTQAELDASPALFSMVNGGIRIARVVDPLTNPNWKRHLQKWPTYEMYQDEINSMLPPHGLNNSLGCKNSNFQYKLSPGYFGRTVHLANEVWAQAFDTVLAFGMAVCRLAPTGTDIPGGKEIFAQMLNTSFSGMSSYQFKFSEKGDPDITTAGFRLVNYFSENPNSTTLTTEFVGSINPETLLFSVDLNAIHYRGGLGIENLPRDIIPPVHEMNKLPDWLRILGYCLFAIICTFGLLCGTWLIRYSREKIVVNSQSVLMWMILFGCIVAGSALIPLTADDFDSLDENISCTLSPILFTFGFQISTVAISAKTYRIYSLFHNPKLKRYTFTLRKLIGWMAVFLSLPTLFAILWWTISPLRYIRVFVYKDNLGNPIESFGMCDAPTPFSGAMLIISFLLYGISIAGVSYFAYKARNIPSDYHEAKWIAVAVISQSQLFFIAVPTIAAVYRSVLGRFILQACVVFLSVMIVLFAIFLPKMLITWTGRDITPKAWIPSKSPRIKNKHTVSKREANNQHATTTPQTLSHRKPSGGSKEQGNKMQGGNSPTQQSTFRSAQEEIAIKSDVKTAEINEDDLARHDLEGAPADIEARGESKSGLVFLDLYTKGIQKVVSGVSSSTGTKSGKVFNNSQPCLETAVDSNKKVATGTSHGDEVVVVVNQNHSSSQGIDKDNTATTSEGHSAE